MPKADYAQWRRGAEHMTPKCVTWTCEIFEAEENHGPTDSERAVYLPFITA